MIYGAAAVQQKAKDKLDPDAPITPLQWDDYVWNAVNAFIVAGTGNAALNEVSQC